MSSDERQTLDPCGRCKKYAGRVCVWYPIRHWGEDVATHGAHAHLCATCWIWVQAKRGFIHKDWCLS